MKIIDISVPIDENLPVWPNTSGFAFKSVNRISEKGGCNETHLEMNAHVGTHVDAPLHFVKDGLSIDQAPLEIFMGEALVVYLPEITTITAKDLEKINFLAGTQRALFKTENSKLWEKGKNFNKDYVGLTTDAAKFLVEKGIKLVGIDYLSIAKMSEAVEVHQILLGNGVYILEGLNLSQVDPGVYQLACLPTNLRGVEAAPARAVLFK